MLAGPGEGWIRFPLHLCMVFLGGGLGSGKENRLLKCRTEKLFLMQGQDCCLCSSPTYHLQGMDVQRVFAGLQISLPPLWCQLYPWGTHCHLPEWKVFKTRLVKISTPPGSSLLGIFISALPEGRVGDCRGSYHPIYFKVFLIVIFQSFEIWQVC